MAGGDAAFFDRVYLVRSEGRVEQAGMRLVAAEHVVLLERECCVCEVMQPLHISQARASRNLGILQDAGFVRSRRDGLWIVYSVDEQRMKNYTGPLVELLRNSLVNEKILLQDRERLSQAVRVGPKAKLHR